MPLAYSYLRMSRPEQLRGDSLRRQLEGSRAYAAEHGLTLDESLQDLGVSAFRGRNRTEGALAEFLNAIEEERVPAGSVLIVENLDRLSREQVNTALRQFLGIIDAGITIVTLSDGQVYSQETMDGDITRLLMSIFYMARAHDESAQKAARLAAAWKNKRARLATDPDAKLTARIPAWLTLATDRRGFRVREERATAVRRIYEECAAGMGAIVIARRLTEDGVCPFGRSKGWQPSSVKKILDSEAVLGRFQPHRMENGRRVPDGEPVEGYFPKIIETELHAAARAALTRRKTGAGGQKGRTHANLFAGLLRCVHCEGPMHFLDKGAPPKGGRYVQCDHARRRARDPATGEILCRELRLWRYQTLEYFVLASLPDLDVRLVLDKEEQVAAVARRELEVIEEQLQRTNKKLRRLMVVIEGTGAEEDGDEIDDELARRVTELRSEIAALKARRKDTKRNLPAAPAVDDGDEDLLNSALERMEQLEADGTPERYRARATFAAALRRVIAVIKMGGLGAEIQTHAGNSVTLVYGGVKRIESMVQEQQAEFLDTLLNEEDQISED